MRLVAESDVRSRNQSQGERALERRRKISALSYHAARLALNRRWLLGALGGAPVGVIGWSGDKSRLWNTMAPL